MAEDFAQTAAESLQKAGFDVLLSQSYAPTPALVGQLEQKMLSVRSC